MRPLLQSAHLLPRLALASFALVSLAACQDSDVSRAVGARCDGAAECDDRCLTGEDWPGGFCTLDCDSDDDCPDGSTCAREDSGGVCAFTCVQDLGCEFLGAGYTCQERDHVTQMDPKVLVCRG